MFRGSQRETGVWGRALPAAPRLFQFVLSFVSSFKSSSDARSRGPRPAGPEVRRRLEARRILRYLGLRAAQACLPMNPLVPLKGVNHLLYSSHTSWCRPGPARPADHFDHHDRSAHHTLRPSCPHPGATRRHSTHSHEPSDPRTTPPPSVCSLPWSTPFLLTGQVLDPIHENRRNHQH